MEGTLYFIAMLTLVRERSMIVYGLTNWLDRARDKLYSTVLRPKKRSREEFEFHSNMRNTVQGFLESGDMNTRGYRIVRRRYGSENI